MKIDDWNVEVEVCAQSLNIIWFPPLLYEGERVIVWLVCNGTRICWGNIPKSELENVLDNHDV